MNQRTMSQAQKKTIEKRFYKYKCRESGCSSVVDDKKWHRHCETHHKYKSTRHEHIKREIFQYRLGSGPWLPYNAKSDSIAPDDCTQSTHSIGAGASGDALTIHTPTATDVDELAMENTESSISSQQHVSFRETETKKSEIEKIFQLKMQTQSAQPSITAKTDQATEPRCDGAAKEIDNIDDSFTYNDPVYYTKRRLDDSTIHQLLSVEPCQPKQNFVKIDELRSVQASWFHRKLPDETTQCRRWLSYSISAKALFCTTCIGFGTLSASKTWTSTGCSDWDHVLRNIMRHEVSHEHHTAEIVRLQWLSKKRIVDVFDTQRSKWNEQVERNRNVVRVMIDAIKFLAKEHMALRGHESSEGKFRHLFSLLAKYDSSAASYLQMIDERGEDKIECNLLSPRNQKRLVNCMKLLIQEDICKNIASHKAFSLIFDGTTDTSKMEACSIVLRYSDLSDNFGPVIVERLFDVFTTGDTTAENLENKIAACLENGHLKFDWLISQSYDGASNMRGAINGLQARMTKRSPKALYTWCYAHRMNLVIEGMIASCTPLRSAIGLLEELYVFFGGHRRHEVFMESQNNYSYKKTLKRTGNSTRTWRSVEDATQVILSRIKELQHSLQVLSESNEPQTVTGAQGLLHKLNDFNFLICLHIIDDIMKTTGPCSRIFQAISTDLAVAVSTITKCKATLQQHRSDSDKEHFREILLKAKEFAELQGIDMSLAQNTKRKIRKRYADGSTDASVRATCPHQQQNTNEDDNDTYISIYAPALDFILLDFSCRFDLHDLPVVTQMMIFSAGSLLRRKSEILTSDVKIFCDRYSIDVDIVVREMSSFVSVFKENHSTVDMSDISASKKLNATCNLSDSMTDEQNDDRCSNMWLHNTFLLPYRLLYMLSSFPTLLTVYKILVTIAVTSASAERAMSKVKLVKTRLRSTMSDDYFSGMMLLASEKDICDRLATDDIVNRFASLSPVLRKYLWHT